MADLQSLRRDWYATNADLLLAGTRFDPIAQILARGRRDRLEHRTQCDRYRVPRCVFTALGTRDTVLDMIRTHDAATSLTRSQCRARLGKLLAIGSGDADATDATLTRVGTAGLAGSVEWSIRDLDLREPASRRAIRSNTLARATCLAFWSARGSTLLGREGAGEFAPSDSDATERNNTAKIRETDTRLTLLALKRCPVRDSGTWSFDPRSGNRPSGWLRLNRTSAGTLRLRGTHSNSFTLSSTATRTRVFASCSANTAN